MPPPKVPNHQSNSKNSEKAGRRSVRNRRHERKKASAGTIMPDDGQLEKDTESIEQSRQSVNHNLLQSANHKQGSMPKMYLEEPSSGMNTGKRQKNYDS